MAELQGPLQASIWDQGDAVGAWIGDRLLAVVFPTPETLPQVLILPIIALLVTRPSGVNTICVFQYLACSLLACIPACRVCTTDICTPHCARPGTLMCCFARESCLKHYSFSPSAEIPRKCARLHVHLHCCIICLAIVLCALVDVAGLMQLVSCQAPLIGSLLGLQGMRTLLCCIRCCHARLLVASHQHTSCLRCFCAKQQP